jgi:hypothetical protein
VRRNRTAPTPKHLPDVKNAPAHAGSHNQDRQLFLSKKYVAVSGVDLSTFAQSLMVCRSIFAHPAIHCFIDLLISIDLLQPEQALREQNATSAKQLGSDVQYPAAKKHLPAEVTDESQADRLKRDIAQMEREIERGGGGGAKGATTALQPQGGADVVKTGSDLAAAERRALLTRGEDGVIASSAKGDELSAAEQMHPSVKKLVAALRLDGIEYEYAAEDIYTYRVVVSRRAGCSITRCISLPFFVFIRTRPLTFSPRSTAAAVESR